MLWALETGFWGVVKDDTHWSQYSQSDKAEMFSRLLILEGLPSVLESYLQKWHHKMACSFYTHLLLEYKAWELIYMLMQICCSHQFLNILLYGTLNLVLWCYRFLPFLQPGRHNLKTQLYLCMWILVMVCFYILSEICRKIINPLL